MLSGVNLSDCSYQLHSKYKGEKVRYLIDLWKKHVVISRLFSAGWLTSISPFFPPKTTVLPLDDLGVQTPRA